MSNLKRSIAALSGELRGFALKTTEEVRLLRRNVDAKPSSTASDFRHCIEDLVHQTAAIAETVSRLEAMTLDAISTEELIGHCLEVYHSNRRMTAELEDHLVQYGYVPGDVERAPEDPLGSSSGTKPGDASVEPPSNGACSDAAVPSTTLKGNGDMRPKEPFGSLTNAAALGSLSPAAALPSGLYGEGSSAALTAKYNEDVENLPLPPTPSFSSASESVSFGSEMRELQSKYGRTGRARKSTDSVTMPTPAQPLPATPCAAAGLPSPLPLALGDSPAQSLTSAETPGLARLSLQNKPPAAAAAPQPTQTMPRNLQHSQLAHSELATASAPPPAPQQLAAPKQPSAQSEEPSGGPAAKGQPGVAVGSTAEAAAGSGRAGAGATEVAVSGQLEGGSSEGGSVTEQEYASLPMFCRSQLSRVELSEAVSRVQRLAGSKPDGCFSLEEADAAGLGARAKVVVLAMAKLGRAKLEARPGMPTHYRLLAL